LFLQFKKLHRQKTQLTQKSEPIDDSRSGTERGASSSYDLPVGARLAHLDTKLNERSRDRRTDPLGLDIVYEPDSPPSVDLVFVHGLGGTSRQTWSKNRDPGLFWPEKWLPYEAGISTARIMSFGYNAHFSSRSDKDNKLNISDFAKDLLFTMKFATGEGQRGLNIGSIPIIFIVHSMGGLVAKKAMILGQNDEHYKDIIRATSGIVFLSTPHRGASMAQVLNGILSASFLTHSPKEYISELHTNSVAIQEINEQFRNIAPSLSIVSFFETQYTTIGPSSIMVLNKDSSILGYPGEISKPLDADHHNVCKYSSKEDSNYISVRNILKYLIEKARLEHSSHHEPNALNELQVLEKCLGCTNDPHDDLDFFIERKLIGSCEWVLEYQNFAAFLASDSKKSQILWCTGRPGCGKSVLSSFIIQHLLDNNFRVAFYFFRFGDHLKNNIGVLLMSIAYQIAALLPEYRRRLVRLFHDGLNVQKCAPRMLWQKLFVSALFKISITEPLYLVIDGLDECENSPLAVKLLADIISSGVPIRALLVSRATQLLTAAFDKTSKAIAIQNFPLDGIENDLKVYVEDEMTAMHGDYNFKKRIEHRILQKADGNFLWINLVLHDILGCHTEEDVEKVLEEIPKGLEPLYERMDATLSENPRPADLALGRSILMWIACAKRALTVSELAEALKPEYEHVLDLKFSIRRVCGEFVVVDSKDSVAMIHATARDYLIKTTSLKFHIPFVTSHQRMFAKCLSVLISSSSKVQMGLAKSQSFLLYAATSWAFHLGLSAEESDQSSLSLLARFFQGSSVLSWIYILSLSGQLRLLVQASKTITIFLKNIDRLDSEQSPLTPREREKELLSLWAIDLMKLVGKFGIHLISHPRLIFKLVPPFCPRGSILYQQFGSKEGSSTLTLAGFSNSWWNDCLAKFAIPGQHKLLAIECFMRYFAIMISNGDVILYSSTTCEAEKTLNHGERILTWCFDQYGNKLATYGRKKTAVWDVALGLQLCSFPNPPRAKALNLAFAKNEELLISCSDDRLIRYVSTESPENGWQVLGEILVEDLFDGKPCGSPRCAPFNPEGTQIAVSYRGTPLYVWSIEDGQSFLVGRCQRVLPSRPDLKSNSSDIQAICWNPMTDHVLGVLNDGYVFKWHPLEGNYQESSTPSRTVKCSPDGKFFVTSSVDGTTRIWDFHHFTVIYRLCCATPVTGLAIDPNDMRIYDIRENFCNVWKPNALVRFEEADDRNSDNLSSRESSTEISLVSEASFEILKQVTALAVDPENLTYAVGNDEGIITYFGSDGVMLSEWAQAFMTVEHICWSDDGTHVAYSDLGRTIIVKRVNHICISTPPEAVLSAKEEHEIKQLHLSPSGEFLLVAAGAFTKIWSLNSKKIISCCTQSPITYWINSPSDSSQLVGFGYTAACTCDWENMIESENFQIDRRGIENELNIDFFDSVYRRASAQSPLGPGEMKMVVDKVSLTADGMMALVETSQGKQRGRCNKQFMLLSIVDMEGSRTPAITAKPLSLDLRARIGFSLGFLAADFPTAARRRSSAQSTGPAPSSFNKHVFAFLDKEFWVCTCFLGESQTGRIRRHYILPREWWNMDSLELAVMRSDGALLCPRNGEVAIITNGLREEWIA
jgi:WD40 repeat protein